MRPSKPIPINEIEINYGNVLYMIVYLNEDGESGVDHTTNLMEFYDLLKFHKEHSVEYSIYKIMKGKELKDNA